MPAQGTETAAVIDDFNSFLKASPSPASSFSSALIIATHSGRKNY